MNKFFNYFSIFYFFTFLKWEWRLLFVDGASGLGARAHSPIPTPQSPIPNPQSPNI